MSRKVSGLFAPGHVGFALRSSFEVRIWGKSLPSLPPWVGAPWVVGTAGVEACSVFWCLAAG